MEAQSVALIGLPLILAFFIALVVSAFPYISGIVTGALSVTAGFVLSLGISLGSKTTVFQETTAVMFVVGGLMLMVLGAGLRAIYEVLKPSEILPVNRREPGF